MPPVVTGTPAPASASAPTNPTTPRTEPGDPHHGQYRSWDPYGWVEGDVYYAIFGGTRPAVVKAPSLAGPWRYVGDLLANSVGDVPIEEDVSCADFFRLGDRRMLLCISHRLGCRYYLGDWKDEAFHPTFHARMSWTEGPGSVEAGPFELAAGEPLRLRVFVDRSVVEVFANGRQAVMRRVYPSREDSTGVALFSEGGTTKAPVVRAWDMMPSNPY